MENILTQEEDKLFSVESKITKPLFGGASKLNRILIGILVVAVIGGGVTGYSITGKNGIGLASKLPTQSPKTAIQDTGTFRDFAEGTLRARPTPKNPGEYVEGSHILTRDGAYPVALTSSVVDLSEYEGKKVKVFGETQKALREGWLMDVGRVEVIE